MFTALQFLRRERYEKGLFNLALSVTMQTAEKASPLRRRTCRREQVGGVSDHSFSHRVAWSIWKQHVQRVTESKWDGAEITKNKRKICKKSFWTYLGGTARAVPQFHIGVLRSW